MKAHTFSFSNRIHKHSVIVKTGLFTATAIIVFKIIKLFVVYQYIRFDLYLCFVAILFFTMGIFFNKNKALAEEQSSSQPNVLLLLSARELQGFTLVAQGKTNKKSPLFNLLK